LTLNEEEELKVLAQPAAAKAQQAKAEAETFQAYGCSRTRRLFDGGRCACGAPDFVGSNVVVVLLLVLVV
jgi:hypothetical protein